MSLPPLPMKKKPNKSLAASAFQIALALASVSLLAVLFASTFRAAPVGRSPRVGAVEPASPKFAPVRMAPEGLLGPVSFQSFENPAPVPKSLLPSVNALINNNTGITSCNDFTQSETSVVSFGTTIVAGFNDSGSFAGGATNHFTGYSRPTDGGAAWSDGGT